MDKAFDALSRVTLRAVAAGVASLTSARYLGCTFRIINKPAMSSNTAVALLGAGVTFAGSALSYLPQIRKMESFTYAFLANSFASGAILASLTLSKRFVELTRRDAAILTLISSLCHFVFLKLEFRKLDRIKECETKITELGIRITEYETKTQEYETKTQEYETKIKGNELAIQTLKDNEKTQIQEKETEISQLTKKLTEASRAKKDDQRARIQQELKEAEVKNLISLQKEMQDTASLNELALEKLNKEVVKLKQEADILNSEKNALQKDCNKHIEILGQAETLLSNAKAEREELEKQIQEKEQKIETLQNDKVALEENNKDLIDEAQDNKKAIERFTLEIGELKEQIEELKGKLNKATESNKDLNLNIETSKKEIKAIREESTKLLEKEKVYVQEIKELKAKLETYGNKIPRITQEQVLEFVQIKTALAGLKKDGFSFEGGNAEILEHEEVRISKLEANIKTDQEYDKRRDGLLSDLNDADLNFNENLGSLKASIKFLEQAKAKLQASQNVSERIKDDDIFLNTPPGTPDIANEKENNPKPPVKISILNHPDFEDGKDEDGKDEDREDS